MANAENALKARLGKLKKKADELGVFYQDDVNEETLKAAIEEAKMYTAPPVREDTGAQAIEIGKVIAQEMGKAIRQITNEPDESGLIDERDMDPDDVGEEKIYFTPQFFWIVPAKRIGGQLVKAPYKKMVFQMDHGTAVRNGEQWQTRYISTYKTNSKREQAFLETHPLYKRVFFSNSKEAEITTEQVKFAQKFAQHIQTLNVRMAPELYRMAADHGIKVDSKMSLPTLRTNIANALAKRDMANEEMRTREMIAAAGRADLLQAKAI